MSQDETRRKLPGHADFRLPRPDPVRTVNGNHPLNGRASRPGPVDVWDQRVARGLAFLR